MATPSVEIANNVTRENLNQMPPAIPQMILKNISEKTGPAICSVVTGGGVGIGALYNVDAGIEQPIIFATSKHVLSIDSAQSGKTELHFSEVEALKNVTLKKEWIAYIWDNENLDVTIIEFTASAVAELKAKSAKLLSINAKTIDSSKPLSYYHESLKKAIAQYAIFNNKIELLFAYNSTISISIDGALLTYCIETTSGNSGSPVFNWEGEALALHQGAWDGEQEIPKLKIREVSNQQKSVMWQAVLPAFLAARTIFQSEHW